MCDMACPAVDGMEWWSLLGGLLCVLGFCLGCCFGFELGYAGFEGGEVVPVAVALAGLALAFLLLDLGVNLGDFLLEVGTATLEVLDDFVLFHCCGVFNRLIV